MPISSTTRLDTVGYMRQYHSTVDLSTELGGSATYYKCASVDTGAETWTGYKAVLNAGIYTFEATTTTGLTYTINVPILGIVYTEDAKTIIVDLNTGMPSDSLLMYAPLNALRFCPTAHKLVFNGDVTEGIQTGMPYTNISNDNYITFLPSFLPVGGAVRSFSFWAQRAEGKSIFSYGGVGTGTLFNILIDSNTLTVDFYNGGLDVSYTPGADIHHYSVVINSATSVSVYVDSELLSTASPSTAINTQITHEFAYIGSSCEPNYQTHGFVGKISAFRAYGKALSAAEVAVLASEF